MSDFEFFDRKNEQEIKEEIAFIRTYTQAPHLPLDTSHHINALLDEFMKTYPESLMLDRLKKVSYEVKLIRQYKSDLMELYKSGAEHLALEEVLKKARASIAEMVRLLNTYPHQDVIQ